MPGANGTSFFTRFSGFRHYFSASYLQVSVTAHDRSDVALSLESALTFMIMSLVSLLQMIRWDLICDAEVASKKSQRVGSGTIQHAS